mmetsp:Transcript_12573/g.30694  ORF Transcript_12573/g.30694 Transcript_12573/m.30694 type:complete len:368 (+) Transcript_12573:44-1147(+)
MGGDGGTISSNRTYLRGAGKACHTADHPSNALKRAKLEDAERAKLVLSTCSISGAALDLSPSRSRSKATGTSSSADVSGSDIVACPHGKLYRREMALEALLHRSRTGGGGGEDGNAAAAALGSHIRGMKDLHPVRFHVTKSSSSEGGTNGNGKDDHYSPACPITGSDIGSGNVPCFVIVRTKKSKDKKRIDDNGEAEDDEVAINPNVLGERAIKEMGARGLQAEYGPFDERDMIRLAPPRTGGIFEGIQRRWEARMEEERVAKLQKKKDKKRKRGGVEDDPKRSRAPSASSTQTTELRPSKNNGGYANGGKSNRSRKENKKSAVDEARSTVKSAVAQNPVLSNLFGAGKKDDRTEKKKREDLFTRNC